VGRRRKRVLKNLPSTAICCHFAPQFRHDRYNPIAFDNRRVRRLAQADPVDGMAEFLVCRIL
jgi:hypothetical protein